MLTLTQEDPVCPNMEIIPKYTPNIPRCNEMEAFGVVGKLR